MSTLGRLAIVSVLGIAAVLGGASSAYAATATGSSACSSTANPVTLSGVKFTGGVENVSVAIDTVTKNPCFPSVDITLERMDSIGSDFHVLKDFVYSGDVTHSTSWIGAASVGVATLELFAHGILPDGSRAAPMYLAGDEVPVTASTCTSAAPALTLAGAKLSTTPGSVTLTIDSYYMSACYSAATLVISLTSDVHQGYRTADSVTVNETGTHGYSRTFPVPTGWVGVSVGSTGTRDGNFVELATLASLTATVPEAPAPVESPTEQAPVTPTPTASATATPTATATATPADAASPAPSAPGALSGSPVSTVSDGTTAMLILAICLIALIVLIPLVVLFVRRRRISRPAQSDSLLP